MNPSNNPDTTNQTAEPTQPSELEVRMQKASDEIQKILAEYKLALQPFIAYLVYGIFPRVRLVDVTEQPNATEQTDNTKETGVTDEPDSAAGSQ
jgi:hypothetical protein